MEAIILAGGLGTRLSSRLSDLPKAMAPIAGQPFLKILLEQLLAAGCGHVILSVGYRHQVILDRFRDSYRGMSLGYVIEEIPRGTGGAIRLALQHAKEPSVLVLNGDTFLELDFATMLSVHATSTRPITIAVTNVNQMARYGGVVVDQEHAIGFVEKGRTGAGWINAGVYAIDRDFPWPEDLPPRFSFEMDVLTKYLQQLHPTVFRCDGRFLDIGTPEDLDRAQTELLLADRKSVAN